MIGYIQAHVLGRMRGLKFGMIALQQISLESAKLGKVLGSSVDIAMVPVIVYWGLWNNCYVKREDPDFDFEAVANWVDDNVTKPELLTPIIECLYQSRSVPAEEGAAVKDEKKSTT